MFQMTIYWLQQPRNQDGRQYTHNGSLNTCCLPTKDHKCFARVPFSGTVFHGPMFSLTADLISVANILLRVVFTPCLFAVFRAGQKGKCVCTCSSRSHSCLDCALYAFVLLRVFFCFQKTTLNSNNMRSFRTHAFLLFLFIRQLLVNYYSPPEEFSLASDL